MIREDLYRLSVEIGERAGGGYGEAEASCYIADRMRSIGLSVCFEPFEFIGWTEDRPATLAIKTGNENQKVKCIAMPYTAGTPSSGVSGLPFENGSLPIIPGRIEWPRLDIVSSSRRCSIIANPNGPALPVPHTRPLIANPTVIIGKEDFDHMRSLMNNNLMREVEIHSYGRLVANCKSQNVVGWLGNLGNLTIQLSAHMDTVCKSPGAVDNASGIAAMLRIAEKLTEKNRNEIKNLAFKFIGFGCEENYLFGSTFHAMEQLGAGQPDKTAYCVNLDMLGAEGTLSFRIADHSHQNAIREWTAQHFEEKIKFDTPKASTDFWPFHQQGIPGIDVGIYPNKNYHLPSDNIDFVSVDRIEKTASCLAEIIWNVVVPRLPEN